jgi:RimJ/RimL family protein N-acetyltransferase
MAPVIDYAFVDRDCARLVGITDPKNQASRTAMERLSFVFDADIHAYGVAQMRYVLDRDDYPVRRSG